MNKWLGPLTVLVTLFFGRIVLFYFSQQQDYFQLGLEFAAVLALLAFFSSHFGKGNTALELTAVLALFVFLGWWIFWGGVKTLFAILAFAIFGLILDFAIGKNWDELFFKKLIAGANKNPGLIVAFSFALFGCGILLGHLLTAKLYLITQTLMIVTWPAILPVLLAVVAKYNYRAAIMLFLIEIVLCLVAVLF
jgi:hypothetical protein